MVARPFVNPLYSLTSHTVEAFSDGLCRELSTYSIEVCAVESGLRAKLGAFGSDQAIDGYSFSL